MDTQLKKTIEEMEYLEELNIHCTTSFQPYLNLKIKLKELTIRTVIRSKKDMEVTQDWVTNGFTPPNLNIVVLNGSIYPAMTRCKEVLLSTWPKWNSKVPTGHVACLKLYVSYKIPLCLFQNAPLFQLRYGEAVALPFVDVTSGGLHSKWLLLTDHDDGNKTVHKAISFEEPSHTMYHLACNYGIDTQLQLDDIFTTLTELDFSECYYRTNYFKQIISNCLQLQQLNMGYNASLSLVELQMVATCCNLQGLYLQRKLSPNIEFCIKAWEILSNMKLIYLSMDIAFLGSSSKMEDIQMKQLAASFAQCTPLRALELHFSYGSRSVAESNSNIYKLLAHFPSLEYCRLCHGSEQSGCAKEVLTSCKSLRYFYCNCSVKVSLSLANNKNLQQLCISSKTTDLNDNFMDTISNHGELIHVALFVNSVTTNGITTLIQNSPDLLTFGLGEQKHYKESYLKSLNTSLHKKFTKRKLFTIGLFGIIQKIEDRYGIIYDEQYTEYDDWLHNTDLLALWAPFKFVDLTLTPSYRSYVH